jgi:S1-C subfamily serine protease
MRLNRIQRIKIMPERMKFLLCTLLVLGACSSTPPVDPVADDPDTTPQDQVADFDSSFSAVVGIFANVPEDARTAALLGTRRQGSGVVIDNDGLVLTIGYLILEAEEVIVVGPEGKQIPAQLVAYDHTTGLGLVRARKPPQGSALRLGDSKTLSQGDPVLAVSFDGRNPVVAAKVVSRRPFAGSWEYLQENAIFTIPPHHEYGGAALINSDGELVGIGSLLVNDAIIGERPVIGNMFVPVEDLKPILAALIKKGRRNDPVPPWLGIYTDEAEGRVYITRLAESGPGEDAGLKRGDIIIGVDGKRVGTMIDYLRKIRKQGKAGSEIALDILPYGSHDLTINKISVKSVDRHDWLQLH